MASHRMHFTPPVNETRPDPVATTGESHSLQMQEARREWWGNFVPIADWVPLKMNKSKFDGMKIQKYHISPEIDQPGDPACLYDRAFASANDTISELTAMFQNEWVSNRRAANADMDVSYDLGWHTAPKAGIDSGEMTGQSIGVDPEASYDLGWNSAPDAGDLTPGESLEVNLEATYDLGWDSAPTLHSDLPPETTQPLRGGLLPDGAGAEADLTGFGRMDEQYKKQDQSCDQNSASPEVSLPPKVSLPEVLHSPQVLQLVNILTSL
ncbi:uncharacterized protein HD556DRAFT_1444269 [Suillus plorans]|uniref:Uncharacterized protein n=1 Tax=Suillus plorans TaxID=116603 RepID=A0A9P7AMM1_9AGAM|nr:uncharacterized protein HD556DRAFT_1444269 [Suillus plorans]KAG1792582.1 hypothetical protein HD556DRAFT_1444269 [Suillus plorans]